MISDALQKWTFVIFVFIGNVYPQMPMQMQMQMPMPYPMGGYGPMMMPAPPPQAVPVPMPMPVPVPVPIPIPYEETRPSTTTTTTTDNPHRNGGGDSRENNRDGSYGPIGIPVDIPNLLQIAIPGFFPQGCQNSNKNGSSCPPCPPCTCNPCMPSFFSYCSPCHQECRCKNGQEAPSPKSPNAPQPYNGPAFPMPLPMPVPPPVVIVPFPHRFGNRPNHRQFDPRQESRESCKSHSVSESCSRESSESSCESKEHRKKKKSKGSYDIYRRNNGRVKRKRKDSRLVRPVLSYLSRNGDVKMRRRLSNQEASALMGEGNSLQNVQFMAGEDSNNRPRVVVVSNSNRRSAQQGHRRIMLRDGISQHDLGQGRKELLFRPPENKRISNLSVSFQVSR